LTIAIDGKAPDEPLWADEIVVEDVEKVEVGALELSSPGCDHTSEMHERVTKTAFPRLHRVLYAREEEPSGSAGWKGRESRGRSTTNVVP
jgi:hypothetical protein